MLNSQQTNRLYYVRCGHLDCSFMLRWLLAFNSCSVWGIVEGKRKCVGGGGYMGDGVDKVSVQGVFRAVHVLQC